MKNADPSYERNEFPAGIHKPTNILRCAALVFAGLLLAAQAVFAGGGPAGVVVVYNPTDPRSVTIANEYQQVRGIPERNLVPYAFPATFSRTTAWDFVYALRSTLQARGLESQLQAIALAGITPLSGSQTASPAEVMSLHSFLYLSPDYSQASFPARCDIQKAYAFPESFKGPAPNGTVAMTATTLFSGQHYWPVSSIGFPGKSGNSPREILGFIARAKAHDGAKPTGGTIYWPLNTDVRSTTRAFEINDVKDIWQQRGIRYQATIAENWVSNRPDVQGGIVGIATFTDSGNTYMPGAWVDHLTSNGGGLDSFNPGQTPCSKWLRAGADGSSGTMSEPFANSSKFPHANIQTHLRAGASLVEAFWQSIYYPAEIVCLGDPLLQPFADFPAVTLTAPATGAAVSGNLAIAATAAPTGGKALEANLDLFIDGRRIAIGAAGETVAVTRTAGGFTLDTATLADGWHELRVAAYNNDAVRTQGEAVTTILVNNAGQSIALSGPATVNPDGTATFTVTPAGLGDLASLALQANGRTLAAVPVSGGAVILSGTLAPLANQWSVYAVGTRANGQQVWSAPFTTTVDWPAQAAATGVTPGGAMADVRFFSSTTASGFNWDTTTPDVVTTFPGDATNGLRITGTNVPGVIFTGSTAATLKPGYELKCWLYAPAEDWYELGSLLARSDNVPGFGTPVSCTLDGVALIERNGVYGPRRLAQGWHEVRLRMLVNNTAWSYWQVRLRGGSSQDFAVIPRATCASLGTGAAASTPTILAITPSAAPVTTTTVTLTANATIGDGTPAELAGLTYHWSLLSGPNSVTFSANGTAGQPVTTATFTQTGDYVIGLRVAGASDSAVATLPVTVQAGAPTLVLSTNGATTAVRGMPLNVWAYSQDQFGRRLEVTPTVPGQPTVTWTSTDPNGAFQNLSATGESAQFRSLSALSSSTTCKLTATGANGRTGTATSSTLTIATNASPTSGGNSLFSIFQSGTTNALTFTATVSDPESSQTNSTYGSPTYPSALLSYHWSVVTAPPGGALTLGADGWAAIAGAVSTPGAYSVRLDVTDQAGATASETRAFYVDSVGSLTTSVALSDQILHVGETAVYPPFKSSVLTFPRGAQTFQWQTSADGGATWQDVAGTTTSDGTNDYPTLNYGPLTAADHGRQFRLNLNISGSVLTGLPGTITVVNPAGGTIRIGEAMSAGAGSTGSISVPENAGSATFTVRRCGGSSGAAAAAWSVTAGSATQGVDYLAPDGTANGAYTGTLTWADGDNSDRLITVPIVNDTLAENTEYFSFSIQGATGASIGPVGSTSESFRCYILDDDNAGQAAFRSASATVAESAGAVTIPVSRSSSFAGPLTVNYATQSQTAVAGQDFTAASGTLTWADGESADKQIVVPLLSDSLVEGDETFTVTLGRVATCTVTLQDAPYQQWQKAWWPAAMPALRIFKDYATALGTFSPQLRFRFSETSGTTVAGVDAAGVTVANGTITKTGTGGSYALAQAGPRPSLWPGLESGNTALAFTTGTAVTATPPRYSAGASVNCGAANGLGAKLGSGFTLAMFVKTSVTDRAMTLAGGKLTGTYPTTLYVSLNRAHNNSTACVPHAVRIYMAPQGINPASYYFDYSVAVQNLPTGSIGDGQWHHLAITVPAFTTQSDTAKMDYPRFFFDGAEANPLEVRGTETIDATAAFSDFSDTGFRLGADGSATPISFFNGALDEFVFIPRVLSATEIANLCAAQPPVAPPATTADTANPAGDGVPNLMKYALGLDPTARISGSLGLPQISMNGTKFEYAFTRLRDATDITYHVESSTNLSSWSEVWSSASDPYPGAEPSVTEVLQMEVGAQPKEFFRFRVTRP